MLFVSIKPVFLITDIILFSMLSIILLYTFQAKYDTGLAQKWRSILSNRCYNASFVILVFFFSIALLDSCHYHVALDTKTQQPVYSNTIYSVLDTLLSPMGESSERSYSKPFATHSLNKSYIQDEAGIIHGLYTPLNRTKIAHTQTLNSALLTRLSYGLGCLLLITLSYAVYLRQRAHAHPGLQTQQTSHWKLRAIITFGLLSCLFITLITISQYYFVFGTSKVGQDVLYQAIKSIRTGVVIGVATTLFSLPFAITMGLMAGYYGKWVDDIIQYVYTTISAIPSILLISAAILSLQVWLDKHASWFSSMTESDDMRLLIVCLILGLTGWTSLCRLLRAETLKIREMDYIAAAKTLGVSKNRILYQHILPNVMHIVLIITVIDFSGLVLAEAVLSYMNVGVSPSTISWGNMINSARLELARDPSIWWSLSAAFLFMFTLVLAANVFADGVRAVFDPREAKERVDA